MEGTRRITNKYGILPQRMGYTMNAEDVNAHFSGVGPAKDEEKVGLEAMWEVIREIAKNDTAFLRYWGDYECPFCHVIYASLDIFRHDDTCIVRKARALVADIDKGKEGDT